MSQEPSQLPADLFAKPTFGEVFEDMKQQKPRRSRGSSVPKNVSPSVSRHPEGVSQCLFSSQSLCAIIRECHRSDVSAFILNDLRIIFGRDTKCLRETVREVPGETHQQAAPLDEVEIRRREKERQEIEDELLVIEDPVEYERQLLKREEGGEDD